MPSDLLPQTLVADIFAKTETESLLLTLGQRINVGMNETLIQGGDLQFPEAGQVGGTTLESREGEKKPVAGIGYGAGRSFQPIKLAVIVTASSEYVKEDPKGMWRALSTKLPRSLARAADLAVFHGRDALRGTALVGIENNGYINKTTNRVELNPSQPRIVNGTTGEVTQGDVVDQILAGVALVDNDDSPYTVTNFAAMPSLATELAYLRTADATGAPVYQPGASPTDINANGRVATIAGVPTTFNKMVRGKVANFAGTDVRMFGGDFSQIGWGFADGIKVKYSDQASLDNGAGGVINLWQTNQIAILCEATFGWYVNDLDAFVAYDKAA